MKKRLYNVLVGGLLLICVSCESSKTPGNTQETTPSAGTNSQNQTIATAPDNSIAQDASVAVSEEASADTAFVSKASRANMAEVKFGILAERIAMDTDVKNYARQMIQDHRNTNSVLVNIARTKKWLTPENMDAFQQANYDRLNTIDRTRFDKEYMTLMVKNHQEMINMFEQAAGTVSDPELKKYIENTTPALRKHLNDARALQNRLK